MADPFLQKGKSWLDVEEKDIDLDTKTEILISTPLMNLYIDPEEGGSLFEWDYRPKALNLMNNLTRREEGYHSKITKASKDSSGLKTIHEMVLAKEEGLDQYLHYDRYRRVSLLDHFLSPDTSLFNFKDGEYHEQGDFISSPYGSEIRAKGRTTIVSLKRKGKVEGKTINLEKTIMVKPEKSALEIGYHLIGEDEITSLFGVEFNLSVAKGPGRYLMVSGLDPSERDIASHGELFGIKALKMVDEWLGIEINLKTEPEMDLWHFPIETVSQSEGGFERVYQHSVFLPHWTLNLKQGSGLWNGKLILSVEDLNR
jgi:alpha-amylase